MKKLIVAAAFLVAMSSAAWAQTQKPPQRKTYEERMKEKKEAEELKKEQEAEGAQKKGSSTKTAPPARTTPQRPQRKTAEERAKEREEAEAQRKAAQGDAPAEEAKPARTRPERPTPASRRGKEDANPAPAPNAAIVNTYYALPIETLPQVRNYIEDKEDTDTKSLRRGFIRKQDAERGYLHLQLPADEKYTRLQEYKTTEGKRIIAVETSNCSQGECNNMLKFYEQQGNEWNDETEKYMPTLDKKYILSKIKAKYKKDYMDLENYNNKGYEVSEEVYNRAIISGIDGDQNRILIKEQYLSLPLYEMVWDGKSKFILKKL